MPEARDPAARTGRPPATSARTLELVALDLFATQGFEQTTVEQIAAGAGVSTRTFFRYFDAKSSVLWHAFDQEVDALAAALAATPPEVGLRDAIRTAVVSVNRHRVEDLPELRARMQLIGTERALLASAAPHYDAWERVISEFAATRLGGAWDDLVPLTIGRTTLAACRSAFDRWVAVGRDDLTSYLDQALRALSTGFDEAAPRPAVNPAVPAPGRGRRGPRWR